MLGKIFLSRGSSTEISEDSDDQASMDKASSPGNRVRARLDRLIRMVRDVSPLVNQRISIDLCLDSGSALRE